MVLKMKKLSNDDITLIYRIVIAGLIWFTMISSPILDVLGGSTMLDATVRYFSRFVAFTMQTNLFVVLWLTIAIALQLLDKQEILEKISGSLKGAIMLYITITFVFFSLLLAPFSIASNFAGFFSLGNIVLHYIAPIAFIADFLIIDGKLAENKVRYEWKHLPYWFIYAIFYLIFGAIIEFTTGRAIYWFIAIGDDLLQYGLFVFLLISTGAVISCLYIYISRKRE